MDNIELELKRVQLMRERLALEKELKSRLWKANMIRAVKRGTSCTMAGAHAIFAGVGRSIGRWWKWATTGTLSAAAIFGALTWRESIEQTKRDAAQVQYEAQLLKFVRSRCGSDSCDILRDDHCWNTINQYPLCRLKAREDFDTLKQVEKPSRLSAPS